MVKVAPLVGLTVACSLTQFEISAPARADSFACAKAVLTELEYRIYREDANEQELAAVHRTGYSTSYGATAHDDLLAIRVHVVGGTRQLEVGVGGGSSTYSTNVFGEPVSAVGGGYMSPTEAAKADAETLVQQCGVAFGAVRP